ncbi:DUF2335 domain-containing protein [Sorangium sp. KYC3313]|uniref:DUF2335 domain-containing protein n=1 Tax=Sorangium sp. KYC3313 TaxID=3449740 RepID=UPI003F8A9337
MSETEETGDGSFEPVRGDGDSERAVPASNGDDSSALTESKGPALDRIDPPAELARLVTSVVRTQVQKVKRELSFYDGPLPPPSMLSEYDQVLPGLAERIVKSFEEEGPHRRSLQHREMLLEEREMTQLEKMTDARIVVMKRAQWLAFSLSIAWVVVIVSLVAVGLIWQPALLGAVQMIGTIVYFSILRREKKSDIAGDASSSASKPPKQLN